MKKQMFFIIACFILVSTAISQPPWENNKDYYQELTLTGRQYTAPSKVTSACSDNNITFVSAISFGTTTSSFVKGDYAYVAISTAFLIFNISDPGNPQLIGHTRIMGGIGSFVLRDNLVYGIGYFNGLRIIDVSDITNPVEIGSFGNRYLGKAIP